MACLLLLAILPPANGQGVVRVFPGSPSNVFMAVVHPVTGEMLSASGSSATLWTNVTASAQPVWSIPTVAVVRSVAFNPLNQSEVLIGTSNVQLRLKATGASIMNYTVTPIAQSVEFNPLNDSEILTGSTNAQLWHKQSATIIRNYTCPQPAFATFNPHNATEVLVACKSPVSLQLLHRGTAAVIQNFILGSQFADYLVFNPNTGNEFLSTHYSNGTVALWNRNSPAVVRVFSLQYASAAAFNPNNDSEIIAVGQSHGVSIWHKGTGTALCTYSAVPVLGQMLGVTFNPWNTSEIIAGGTVSPYLEVFAGPCTTPGSASPPLQATRTPSLVPVTTTTPAPLSVPAPQPAPTPSPSPLPSPSPSSPAVAQPRAPQAASTSRKLSTPGIIAIAVGSAIVVALCAALVWLRTSGKLGASGVSQLAKKQDRLNHGAEVQRDTLQQVNQALQQQLEEAEVEAEEAENESELEASVEADEVSLETAEEDQE
eukprot:TRINITY_DN26906_c0_g1_i1.p1 TRINITY_DN26906_c0_g1~~TRINITY_DN26906_c0_g1_i1.p1  ORF type:complete len:492 (+),score=71.63 TRINITY_DN26906_c0_g1_i1:23-1477(+)